MKHPKNKDAHLKKILAELNLSKKNELTLDQEDQFRRSYDSEFDFQKRLETIFNNSDDQNMDKK